MKVNNKKIYFLIFSPLFAKGGHSKNFLNLIKHLEPEICKNNYESFIVSYNNNSADVEINNRNILKHQYLISYKIKLIKRIFPSGKIPFQIFEYFINLIRTLILIIRNKPDVVYAYSDKTLFLSFLFKPLFNYKLLYDMRGDAQNEIKVQGASYTYLKGLALVNNLALKSVNLIFTVTSESKPTRQVSCVPKYNYYDGSVFKYNNSLIINKKKELGLENKFIFVYNGNAHYYQFLDETTKFFSQFFYRHSNSFFLIITEFGSEKFIKLLEKYNVPETAYLIISLPQSKISEIQQIADMGFLLREDLPLNHHSYPTKYAEYLASGVPVLTTPHIYSIAPMVLKNNLGEVIAIQEDYSSIIDNIYTQYFNNLEMKKHCSEYAKKELMWQKKATDIFNIINQL